jgi:hypothetical protein
MQKIQWFFNSLNYGFGIFYSFTFIDVLRKLFFGEFLLTNATNFVQFLLTLLGLFFAYFKLQAYRRDSKIKSKILEEELTAKRNMNFYTKFDKEFLDPFKEK